MAIELQPRGIRVCAIAPGGVDTEMPRRIASGAADPEAELLAGVRKAQLVGRLASPEEIADAMFYLASDSAAMCAGTTFWMDGGSSVL